jgi:hypothetical protein
MAIDWPQVSCVCWPKNDPEYGICCVCDDMERSCRAWSAHMDIPAMTPEQRNACTQEIRRVEGFDQIDTSSMSDAELGKEVLVAWPEYARDKGLL